MNDLTSGQYSANKNIRFKTSILGTDLCDYSVIIVVKGTIIAEVDNDGKTRNKKVIIKNNAPFQS